MSNNSFDTTGNQIETISIVKTMVNISEIEIRDAMPILKTIILEHEVERTIVDEVITTPAGTFDTWKISRIIFFKKVWT